MLVLTRGQGEKICIGDNIEITITNLTRSKVKVGIKAPPEINIKRGELKPKKLTKSA